MLVIEGSNAARVLYDRVMTHLPEIASLPEGKGVVLHYANSQELHANCSRRSETEELILAFYHFGSQAVPEEQACYEVQLDHAAKTAHATPLRQEQEQPLLYRLAQLGRHRPQHRERVSPSGHSSANTALYQNLLRLFPNLDAAPLGQARKNRNLPGLCVLHRSDTEMMLEISPTGLKGIERIAVALDKIGKTAGVTEVSGEFGHYPAYLPYPDGKEMTPAERESYTIALSGWLDNLRESGRLLSR